MSGKPLDTFDDDPTQRLDDRWTSTKLYRAGYDLEFERTCRTCGDQIEVWRNLTRGRMLVLNAVVLDSHRCDEK